MPDRMLEFAAAGAYLLAGLAALVSVRAALHPSERRRVTLSAWLAMFMLWPVFVLAWTVNSWRDR